VFLAASSYLAEFIPSAAWVCVMMTAMNLEDLPPALIRSGRVDLWIEMRKPDVKALYAYDLHRGVPPRPATDYVDGADPASGGPAPR